MIEGPRLTIIEFTKEYTDAQKEAFIDECIRILEEHKQDGD